jgi:hypothetical protein
MEGEGFWTLLFKDNVYLKLFDDVIDRYPILRRLAVLTQNTTTKLINLTEYSITRADVMDYIHSYANINQSINFYNNGAQKVMALFGSVQDTRSQMREKAITILRNYGERLFQNLNDPARLFVNITDTHENVSVMIGSRNNNPIYGTCWDNQQDIIEMKKRLLQYCGCEHDPSIMEGIFVPYYNNLTF